jgi:pre-mRNA-splicing helicase BRR2
VELFIADEIHLIGGNVGPTYEVIISRMRFISAQLDRKMRIVALGVSLANALDLGEWIGCTKNTIFNFSPKSRPTPLEVRFQEFNIPHFPSLMVAMSKPTFLAITQLSPDRPVMVFVPDRKQCRLTADELISYAGDQFRLVSEEELEPHLNRLQDQKLRIPLLHGIGYFHEAMSVGDKRIVERLYNAGAIQVVLVSRDVCWSVPMTAHLVVIMGTQYYEGSQHRYRDYLLSDVLQMLGRACRPADDERSRAVLMTPATKKEYYKKFINEALPIESYLQLWLHDAFVTEVSTKTIENKQDAVDWLTWTFFYRRLVQNPSFYGLQDTSHESLSDFLSDLVETTLSELTDAKILAVEDEMDILPMNQAMIAAYYNITWTTLQTFTLSLTAKTKLKGLLEIVTSAAEYEDLPIRKDEDIVLKRVYDWVPVKLSEANYESPHFKAFVLLQAHFSRLSLPADLVTDQTLVVGKVLNLLSACVDVMSSEGWLNAFGAMELSQMVVQATWDRDSPLRQIPHFNNDIIKRCNEAGVETVFDLMEMEDDQRTELLKMSQNQLAAVAGFVNKYPNIDINFEVEDPESITAKAPAFLRVELERDVDEDEEVDTTVHAPFYPGKKMENCTSFLAHKLMTGWLVISSGKELVSIKRVTFTRKLSVKLNFTVPEAGRQQLKLFCFSDSYTGVDQEHEFEVVAGEGEEDEDSDAMDEDE